MFAKFTGTLVAAALALTTVGAAPARADRDDAARVAAALLGIAILGKILSDNNDDRAVTRYRPAPAYRPYNQPRYQPRYARPNVVKPKRLPPRVRHQNAKLLPGHCFRSYQTRGGKVRMFGRRCLKQSFRHVNSLPNRCAIQIRSRGNTLRGYDARCLRSRGYALARR